MVLTGKRRLGPDIWSKIPEQAESTEDIIRSIWGKEAHWRCKTSGIKSSPLSPSGKKARFMGLFYYYYYYGYLVTNENIDFGFYHEL